MLGSARRASGGFPSRRQLNFPFCSRPKKGSKMGAKMEPFGLQNLNYTRFGAPFGRNWGPKTEKKKGHEKCSKKVTLETRGSACILRSGVGVPYKDPEIRPSERGKPYGHSTCALRARWRIYICACDSSTCVCIIRHVICMYNMLYIYIRHRALKALVECP